jgi:hypothetical protein
MVFRNMQHSCCIALRTLLWSRREHLFLCPKTVGFEVGAVNKQFKFDDFDEVFRAPYRKNLVFGFRKTDNSFHGKYPGETTVEARKTISITVQSKRLFKV